MCAIAKSRRDPAPSRLAYRAQRLWLTPMFRKTLLRGLPLLALAALPGLWFADADRRATAAAQVAALRDEIANRPEFSVNLMTVSGASPELEADLREVLGLDFPISSFDLDLEAMRAAVVGLDAVRSADLRLRTGGVLDLTVTQRVPAVVWRGEGGLDLLDQGGKRVAQLPHRAARPDLPLIAGAGAERKVPEALALIAAAAPLGDRLRGLVRMGERRWDVVLDRDQRILLPETGALETLERVIALDQAAEMLARDVVLVDMRNPARPTLRLAPGAVDDLQRLRRLQTGANEG